MKAKLIAGVIAAAFAAPVMAQSSVQIYGIADAGIHKSTGSKIKIASGIADGSRIGFKGTEDMGGGYKAIFNLEARVELDTGTQQPTLMSDNPGLYLTKGMGALPAPIVAGLRNAIQPFGAPAVNMERALFDRTAYVGLITPGGAILMGRMYTPGYEVFALADTFESGTAGTWGSITGGTAGYSAFGADIRSQKSIQYRIATPNGFNAALMYGGKGSGYLGRYNKFVGLNAIYKANGIEFGYGFNRGYDQNDNKSLTSHTLGGSYTMGDWKFFAGALDQENRNSVLMRDYIGGWDTVIAPQVAPLGAATAAALRNIFVTNIGRNSQIDATSYQIGAHYRIGAGRIMVSAATQNDHTANNSDAKQFSIGYDYNLSKRTDVYAVTSFISNQNDGQYVPGTAGAPGGFAKVPGENTRAIQLGIRHRF
ncbi:porin [Pseudoduganella sp. GCM10020061]|uniref:porin n=1 Tax=Pseudoduganella sp. GCM10020061 TaxID=3317345 RepID=UPI0036328167